MKTIILGRHIVEQNTLGSVKWCKRWRRRSSRFRNYDGNIKCYHKMWFLWFYSIHFSLKIGLRPLMKILTGVLLFNNAVIMLTTTNIIKSCLCTHQHCRPLTCAATGTERWRRMRWRSPWRHIELTFACPPPPRSKRRWRRRMDADVGTSTTTSVPRTPKKVHHQVVLTVTVVDNSVYATSDSLGRGRRLGLTPLNKTTLCVPFRCAMDH